MMATTTGFDLAPTLIAVTFYQLMSGLFKGPIRHSPEPGPPLGREEEEEPEEGGASSSSRRSSRSSERDERDPYGFNYGVKSEEEIALLRKRRKGVGSGKKVAKYYERQNELIQASLKPMKELTDEGEDQKEQARIPVKIAVWASFVANVCLSGIQVYAAVSSLSLSFFATALDSIFDPLSNLLLVYLHHKAKSLDRSKWPVGGTRLETIGNIVYGLLMGAVNLVIIVEAVRSIVERESNPSSDRQETNAFHIQAVVAVSTALGTKILLFLYCYSIRKQSSQVQVLWEDHRNDIIVCAFGLLTSTGGSKLKWYIDPMGAIIIGTSITVLWVYRIYQEFELLAGKSASHEFIRVITYKAMTFDKEIRGVDTVRAYHSGPKYFLEIDLILSPDLQLRTAHDIGQRFQDEIEELPGVDRAFVHLDWEGFHKIEHQGTSSERKKTIGERAPV